MRKNRSSSGTAKRTAESDGSAFWDDDIERTDGDFDMAEIDKLIAPNAGNSKTNREKGRTPAWQLIERYKEEQWLKRQLELSGDLSFDELH